PGSLVTATAGVYDREAETLDLYGDVQFRTENGYLFATAHARAYVAEGRVMGEQPIAGEGPLGRVAARRFEIWDSGARIIFKLDVNAQIHQEPTAAPELREAVAAELVAASEDMIR
ncbi:MAG: hypothetical protein MI723_11005, partial [Caulobacterales bacterium]|nr:hypothetical protein [Caulobacterales bacterium]